MTLSKSLTFVLPVHNGEARLRRHVDHILEVAGDLTDRLSILIVDDGSTDDTYEVAGQLAATFPQVSVVRHGRRRGLGQAIQSVRRHVHSDLVIVHDGVTRLDAYQVRRALRECAERSAFEGANDSSKQRRTDARELAEVSSVHRAMVEAHQRVMGLVVLESEATDPDREDRPGAELPSQTTTKKLHGIGQIPPLPAPNFLSAVADFALGE